MTGWAVDRIDLPAAADRALAVDRVTDDVEDAPKRWRTDRHADRATLIDRLHAAHQAIGAGHRHCAYPVVAEVLLHLQRQGTAVALGQDQRIVNFGQAVSGNSTSTTGPVTCTTRPVAPIVAVIATPV